VTIPLKEALWDLLGFVSPSAKKIGAVNTLVMRDGQLEGHNTDWVPIAAALSRRASGRALVAGAGGAARAACFAVVEKGWKLVVYARNPEKGKALADAFGGAYVQSLSPAEMASIGAVISTVPGSAQFSVPSLESKPLIFESAYIPKETKLVEQGRQAGCEVVLGVDMLLGQGFEQHKLWCGSSLSEDHQREVTSRVLEFYAEST